MNIMNEFGCQLKMQILILIFTKKKGHDNLLNFIILYLKPIFLIIPCPVQISAKYH